MIFYTVYKTVNLTNGKYYFGVHKTDDPNDDYLGSGVYIKRAVAKHGEQSFRKEVLFIYLDLDSAYGKEDELIQGYRDRDPLCMNLRNGGRGGWDWVFQNGLHIKGGQKANQALQRFLKDHPDVQERNTKRFIESSREWHLSNPKRTREIAAKASAKWKGVNIRMIYGLQ